MIKTEIFCTLLIEGIHNWNDCDIPEVSYLTHPHRHIFHITAFAVVNHSNRDLEFIELKHKIQKYIHSRYFNTDLQLCDFGSQSCEMLGEELIDIFFLSKVVVNEDNENGAILTVVNDDE